MTTTQRDLSSLRAVAHLAIAAVTLCFSQLVAAGETITYLHDDGIGSPVLATDVNGIQVWKETYRPYGDQLVDSAAAENNEVWFAGKQFDDSTGLSYMGARYYDPTLGRFIAVDPASFDFSNLHSFNRYAYANNNPYKYVDPDGELAQFVLPAIVATGAFMVAGCQAGGSCQQFGQALVDFGTEVVDQLAERQRAFNMVLRLMYMNSPVVRYLNENKQEEGESEGSNESEDGGGDGDDRVDRPPSDAVPIDKTPWSGDHGQIKKAIGAGPQDKVRVDSNGDVWVQNPDGTWTNGGNASDITGRDDPSGRKGKDRDRERQEQRDRRKDKSRDGG